jgi:hypothetical protein
VLAAAALPLRGGEWAAVTGRVADPGAGAGVERLAVARLPAGEDRDGGAQLPQVDLGRGEQFDLGATFLAVEVDTDPPTDQPHRFEIAQAASDRLVVAIASVEPIASNIPGRMDWGSGSNGTEMDAALFALANSSRPCRARSCLS